MTGEPFQPTPETGRAPEPPRLNERGKPFIEPSSDDLDNLQAAKDLLAEQPEDETVREVYEEILEDLSDAWLQANYAKTYGDLLKRLHRSATPNSGRRSNRTSESSDVIKDDHDAARAKVVELYEQAGTHLISLIS